MHEMVISLKIEKYYIYKNYNDAVHYYASVILVGARCSSVVRAFAHGAMGRRIDPTWGRPIGLFLF